MLSRCNGKTLKRGYCGVLLDVSGHWFRRNREVQLSNPLVGVLKALRILQCQGVLDDEFVIEKQLTPKHLLREPVSFRKVR